MRPLLLMLPLLLLAGCGQSGDLYLPDVQREAAVTGTPDPLPAEPIQAPASPPPAQTPPDFDDWDFDFDDDDE